MKNYDAIQSGEAIENLEIKLMTTSRKETENILRRWGFDPDKPVSCMTVGQLYELIEFAILKNK